MSGYLNRYGDARRLSSGACTLDAVVSPSGANALLTLAVVDEVARGAECS